MAPSVSVGYNSALPNGILGVGWSVAGLSTITRDPSYAIVFDDNLDHFLYDGQKLIKGADGFYHTKTESFLRIQLFNPNSATSYWTITDKQGKRTYLGSSTDSHIESVNNTSKTRLWAMNKVIDTLGNYYTISYAKDTTLGGYYPNEILYTKNDSAQPSQYSTVDFSYETRADVDTILFPSLIDTNLRLKWVTVRVGTDASGNGGNLFRKYRLDYQYGASTGRSRVVAIQPYGNDGDIPARPTVPVGYSGTGSALPPTQFVWQDGTEGWTSVSDNSPAVISGRDSSAYSGWDQGVRFIDLDGNGITDMIIAWANYGVIYSEAYINTPTGWKEAPQYKLPSGMYISGRDPSAPGGWDCGVRFVDLYGDGRLDVEQSWNNFGIQITKTYRNTGANNGPSSAWQDVTTTYGLPVTISARDSSAPCGWDQGVRFVDLNGDGLVDVVQSWNNIGRYQVSSAWLNTGSGWQSASNYTPPLTISARDGSAYRGWDQGVRFIDLNGDGLPDIVQSWNNFSSSVTGSWVNQEVIPDILATITPTGGTISVTYTAATQVAGAVVSSGTSYPILPNTNPRQVVTKIANNDGVGGTSSTSYSYSNGLVLSGYPWLRQDLGFASTTATVDSTGAHVITYYRQDPPYAGLVDKIDTFGSDGKLYKEARNYYASSTTAPYSSSDPNITFVYKTAQEEYNYNGETTADVYREEYTYDAYGDITLTNNKGNVADSKDEIQTTTTYVTNTSAWIFLPSSKTTSSYSLSDTWGVAAEEQYFYDNLPSGQVSTGVLTSKILGFGSVTTTQAFGYDAYGNLIWTKDGRANAGEYTTHTTETTIDPSYHAYVTAKSNALGQTTTTAYDYLMRPVSTTDPNNQISTVVYDMFSRQVATIAPLDSSSSSTTRTIYIDTQFPSGIHTQKNAGSTTIDSYAYVDGFGRTIQTKQQDVNGNWVTIDTYHDGAGRAYKTSVPYENSTYAYTTRDTSQKCTLLQFDPIGRVSQRTNTDGTFSQTIYGQRSITTVDENGHVTVQNTVDRRTTTNVRYTGIYPTQQVYSTTTLKKAFDGERVTDPNGNVMQTSLDALGRKTAFSDPDMGSWSYSYDADANVVSQTDAKGQTRTFQYDFLNRIVKKQYPDATSVDYGYDETSRGVAPIGHVTTVSFLGGVDYYYYYDARGRVNASTRILGGQSRSIAYTYDSLDRATSKTYPDGEVVNYSYDARGNLVGLTGAGSYSYVSGIQYGPNNRMSQMIYGNGTLTQYDYYDASTKPDRSAGTTFSYRLRGISITGGLSTIASTTYQYDKKDNVMVKNFTDGSQYYTEQFGYDEMDRLVSAQSADLYRSKTYQYDALDNITSKDGRSYTCGTNQPHAVQSDGTYTYQYDANGNMISRSDGRSIGYDFENHVASIFNIGTYSYDADGQRTTKTESGATTYYFFPDYEETQQSGQSTVVVKYYFADGMRVAERSSTDGLLFYHTDHLGSAIRITDASGTIVRSMAYDPYGADAYNSGTVTISYKYTDQVQDAANGLYYFGARYYDPVLGRYISPDTMLQGLNRYTYCGGNPVKYNDPTGHLFGIDDIIIFAVIGVVVGSYIGGSIANNNWDPIQWNWNSINTWTGMALGGAAGGLIGAGVGMLTSGAYTLTAGLGNGGLWVNIVGNNTMQAAAWSQSAVSAFLGISTGGGEALNGLRISLEQTVSAYQENQTDTTYLPSEIDSFLQGSGDPAFPSDPLSVNAYPNESRIDGYFYQQRFENLFAYENLYQYCLATAILNSWQNKYDDLTWNSAYATLQHAEAAGYFAPATGKTDMEGLYLQLSIDTHVAPPTVVGPFYSMTRDYLSLSGGAIVEYQQGDLTHYDFMTSGGIVMNSFRGWQNSNGLMPYRYWLIWFH